MANALTVSAFVTLGAPGFSLKLSKMYVSSLLCMQQWHQPACNAGGPMQIVPYPCARTTALQLPSCSVEFVLRS